MDWGVWGGIDLETCDLDLLTLDICFMGENTSIGIVIGPCSVDNIEFARLQCIDQMMRDLSVQSDIDILWMKTGDKMEWKRYENRRFDDEAANQLGLVGIDERKS